MSDRQENPKLTVDYPACRRKLEAIAACWKAQYYHDDAAAAIIPAAQGSREREFVVVRLPDDFDYRSWTAQLRRLGWRFAAADELVAFAETGPTIDGEPWSKVYAAGSCVWRPDLESPRWYVLYAVIRGLAREFLMAQADELGNGTGDGHTNLLLVKI